MPNHGLSFLCFANGRAGTKKKAWQKHQILAFLQAVFPGRSCGKAGISITFLSNIERGNNFPQAGTLCALAGALDISAWELFRGSGDPESTAAIADRISENFARHLGLALEEVRKEYSA